MANPTASPVLILLLGSLVTNIGNDGCKGTHRETGMLISWMNQIQDPKGSLRDWVPSPVSPCNWTGIVCDRYHLQVVQINLSNTGLSGPLDSVLGQLQLLASFNSSTNNFSGDLPQEICGWANLQVLGLHRNSFSGPIPDCLSDLRQLRVMDLSHNKLNGSIPTRLATCSLLDFLDLSYNNLSGQIPVDGVFQTINNVSLGENPKLLWRTSWLETTIMPQGCASYKYQDC